MRSAFLVLMAAAIALGVGAIAIADAPEFSDWSAPVNIEPPINTSFVEGGDVV